MKKPDGGYAFPTTGSQHYGMTLRDWFAGQALGAKMAPDLVGYEDDAPKHRAELIRRLVRDCYEVADAMIAEREREA